MKKTHRTHKPGSIPEMIAVALPMVVSFSCDTFMTFTDRLFLSKFGSELMSAAMAGGITCFMLMSFVMGLIGYNTALVAQALGAGQKHKCPQFITQALILILLAYPLIIAGRPLIFRFFQFMDIPPAQLGPQMEYFSILLPGTIFALTRHGLSAFFSGIGRTKIVMFSSIGTMIVNVAANYILIFGKFGCPEMGIKGAAFGTILGSIFGVVSLLIVYLSPKSRKEFATDHSWEFNLTAMKKLLRFGTPSGIEMFLNILAFDLLIMTFHAAGLVTAAAATIVFNWDMVSFVPLLGVEIGVTSLVGRYMGARDTQTAHTATLSGLKLGMAYSMIALIFFAGFPGLLVDVFRPEASAGIFYEARPLAITLVRLASIYVLVQAMIAVFVGALRGAGDTLWTMCFTVAVHWILVPVLYVSMNYFKLPPEKAWLILILTFVSLAGIIYARYRGGKWKNIQVIDIDDASQNPDLNTQKTAEAQALIHDDFHERGDL